MDTLVHDSLFCLHVQLESSRPFAATRKEIFAIESMHTSVLSPEYPWIGRASSRLAFFFVASVFHLARKSGEWNLGKTPCCFDGILTLLARKISTSAEAAQSWIEAVKGESLTPSTISLFPSKEGLRFDAVL